MSTVFEKVTEYNAVPDENTILGFETVSLNVLVIGSDFQDPSDLLGL